MLGGPVELITDLCRHAFDLTLEPAGAETNLCQEADVLPSRVVASAATWFYTPRGRIVFPGPPVVVPVAPLDLVSGSGPQKSPRESRCVHLLDISGVYRHDTE